VNDLRNVPSVEGAGSQPPQPARAPRAPQLAVVDAVGAQRHRVDQCHHFASRVRGARAITAQTHEAVRQALDSQPLRKRRDERDPGLGDDPLIVKAHRDAVQSDRPVIVHHEVTS